MSEVRELRGAVLGRGYRLDRRTDEEDEHEYQATHERMPGHFRIRVFPVETLAQPEASSRIQRGARVASLVRDPHVVQVLDFSASGEVPVFVVMERAHGRTLEEILAEDGLFPLGHSIDVIESIAAAVGAGHQIGLVHGDLRPAHIVLPTSGWPVAKLSGFGWAKEWRAAALAPTPSGYLAPEQRFGKVLTLDERVDQFGLAALAYEMLAGCLPFSDESAHLTEVLAGHRTPPAIADMVSGVPSDVDEVLRRGLSFTPSERFGSLTELVSALRAAASARARSRIPTPPTPRPTLPGATPAVKAPSEVTDELLTPVWSADPTIEGGPRASGPGAQRAGSQGAGADVTDDGGDDAQLVLGPASGPIATDQEKTQIRRSPFLTIEDPEVVQPPHHVAPSPSGRGIPLGRPAPPVSANRDGSVSAPILLTPPDRMRPSDALLGTLRTTLGSLRKEVIKRRTRIYPAALGLIVLLAVGVVVRMTGGSHRPTAAVAVAVPVPVPVNDRGQKSPATPPPPRALAPQPSATAPALANEPATAATATTAVAVSAGTPPAPDTTSLGEANPPPATRKSFAPSRSTPKRAAGHRALPRSTTGVASRSPRSATALAPPPAARGSATDCALRITSKPWTEIWIDGKNTGRRTPVDDLKVPCGQRKLQLKRPDKGIEQMEMVKVVPGKPYQGTYDLR